MNENSNNNWQLAAAQLDYAKQCRANNDFDGAVVYFFYAAELGNAEAQYELGKCYHNGICVPYDIVKAIKWYKKAAEQGHVEAKKSLADCYEEAEEQSYENRSADGTTNEERPKANKKRKYNKNLVPLAKQGDADAQYIVGCHYLVQGNVEQIKAKGIDWLREAAKQGHADAQDFLGFCYIAGYAVQQDINEGIKWFKESGGQGMQFLELCNNVMNRNDNRGYHGTIYVSEPVDTDINGEEVEAWMLKVAGQGLFLAQTTLGLLYFAGGDFPKDVVSAIEWFRKAAEQGDETAKGVLSTLNLKKPTSGEGCMLTLMPIIGIVAATIYLLL